MTGASKLDGHEAREQSPGFLEKGERGSTEVISPASKVYVYEAPVRLWHWVTTLCVIVLCVTGYLIGLPPASVGGEASDAFVMGYIRMVHFAAGQILAVFFLMRIYWAFAGNHHARQIFFVPFWKGKWWQNLLHEIKWFSFLARVPKKYVGHNPMAHLAIFFLFLIPLIFQILTGFALYAEGQGTSSWWYSAFGWVFGLFGDNSFFVHTVHRLIMWVIVCFVIIHTYGAIREDVMSRQTMVSAMISGWRYFKDDKK